MIQRQGAPDQVETRSLADTLDAPLMCLSSKPAGWEGLTAEAFFEPMELQGWKAQASPNITLMLFAGGPLYVDRRYQEGPRIRRVMRDGELVLRPDTTGPYEVSWRALSSEPTRALYLHLSRDLVVRTAEELADHDAARVSVVKIESFEDPLVRQIGVTLWQELEQSAPAGKLYAQTAAQLLAVHLLRHYTSAQLQIKEISQNLNQRQVKQVSDFVVANLGLDLSLEDLARQVGFSPYHFARLFRTTTGESPHQFVVRQRVEKAKYLLMATNAPLVHIAHESGFANQSHLTRHFKRYMGLTPKAFRQQQ